MIADIVRKEMEDLYWSSSKIDKSKEATIEGAQFIMNCSKEVKEALQADCERMTTVFLKDPLVDYSSIKIIRFPYLGALNIKEVDKKGYTLKIK